tara:strand:- start:168 stop:1886 length:1719 start_codon:yes stop_codon:yes gene_type:complete
MIFSQDQKRLALVIGNSNYDESPLNNPVKDALLIAKTLKELNFYVILDTNLASKSDFEKKVIEFGDKRADYDVGFIYYAGHGIQVGSENYLLPTKSTFKKETDVRMKALNVNDIMMYLTGDLDQINILILDACRDNPFERNWKKTRSSSGSGLARITPPAGSMIAFSTDAGMTAHDGEGENSIYCKSLSENLLKPNVEINQVFKNVRADVLKKTQFYQSPVENSKLTGDEFYLKFTPGHNSSSWLKKERKIIFNSDEDLFSMFYNVENLFDTIDDPNTSDEDFLPTSGKLWNTYRYSYKLKQLAKVFGTIKKNKNNNKLPNIIGLCEVENKDVIVDLLKDTVFNNHNYSILHQNSSDPRGIDCALLFDNKFELLKNDFIKINNPNVDRPTRDIVYAKLKYNNYILNVFVNHWPSRWGGQEVSNPKRVFVANVLKDYIKKNIPESEYTIIMGDFNDYPANESLDKVLVKDNLFNLMQTDIISGIGSYSYRGTWNWLDQIILSNNFINDDLRVQSGGSFIYNFTSEDDNIGENYIYFKKSNDEVKPSRTFGGDNWYGGFSDHLPVYSRFGFICR